MTRPRSPRQPGQLEPKQCMCQSFAPTPCPFSRLLSFLKMSLKLNQGREQKKSLWDSLGRERVRESGCASKVRPAPAPSSPLNAQVMLNNEKEVLSSLEFGALDYTYISSMAVAKQSRRRCVAWPRVVRVWWRKGGGGAANGDASACKARLLLASCCCCCFCVLKNGVGGKVYTRFNDSAQRAGPQRRIQPLANWPAARCPPVGAPVVWRPTRSHSVGRAPSLLEGGQQPTRPSLFPTHTTTTFHPGAWPPRCWMPPSGSRGCGSSRTWRCMCTRTTRLPCRCTGAWACAR